MGGFTVKVFGLQVKPSNIMGWNRIKRHQKSNPRMDKDQSTLRRGMEVGHLIFTTLKALTIPVVREMVPNISRVTLNYESYLVCHRRERPPQYVRVFVLRHITPQKL